MHDITVCIPYKSGRKLAKAYNEAMDRSQTNWVLFLDWDIFNCNAYWYDMCLFATNALKDYRVGWITCVTNKIGAPQQRSLDAPQNHDIISHIHHAKKLFHEYSVVDDKGILKETVVTRVPGALSGFFILTNKVAWKACGGFDESRKRLMGVDNRYSKALSKAGYQLFIMPGLYFYHIHTLKRQVWNPNGAGWFGTSRSPDKILK
jgi:GT2 family glycosyltransferase